MNWKQIYVLLAITIPYFTLLATRELFPWKKGGRTHTRLGGCGGGQHAFYLKRGFKVYNKGNSKLHMWKPPELWTKDKSERKCQWRSPKPYTSYSVRFWSCYIKLYSRILWTLSIIWAIQSNLINTTPCLRKHDRPPSSGLHLKHSIITQVQRMFYSMNWSQISEKITFQRPFRNMSHAWWDVCWHNFWLSLESDLFADFTFSSYYRTVIIMW